MNIASVVVAGSQAQVKWLAESHASNEGRTRTKSRPVEPRVLALA